MFEVGLEGGEGAPVFRENELRPREMRLRLPRRALSVSASSGDNSRGGLQHIHVVRKSESISSQSYCHD